MKNFLSITFLFLANFFFQHLAANPIFLEGYLDKEKLQVATEELFALEIKPELNSLRLHITSYGADYPELFLFSQHLQKFKKNKNLKLEVVIDKQATGGAAILPLLADNLYVTKFSVWGDLNDDDKTFPAKNILRSQVFSLIDKDRREEKAFRALVEGMIDPSLTIVEKKGKLYKKENGKRKGRALLSGEGERLVLNYNDLIKLNLADEFLFENLSSDPEKIASLEQEVLPSNKNWGLKQKESYRFGHLLINDWTSGIDESTWVYIKSALKFYKQNLPDFLVLELDTPGGEAYTSQKIADLLRDFQEEEGIPIIAFIHDRAYSAGALLAYSCRFIYSTSQSSLGAAEVVFQGSSGMETAPEKINSAFRADFINRARHFKRNPDLAEAMVDKDVILVYRNQSIKKLDDETQIHLFSPHADELVIGKGKLLTLNAKNLIEYNVSTKLSKMESWEGKGELEAYLASAPDLSSAKELLKEPYELSWKLKFLAFLVSPAISSFLFLGLMLGFYYEMSSPGIGLPGAIALVSLLLIALSSLSLDTFNSIDLLLIVLGTSLLLVELFVTPGFALPGAIGLLFLFIGLVSLMTPGFTHTPFSFESASLTVEGEEILKRLAYLFGTFIIASVFIYYLGKRVFAFGPLSSLVSSGEQDKDKGYVAFENLRNLPPIGAIGEAYTVLKPSGKIKIGEELFEASSEGGYISQGTKIKVQESEGSKLIVERFK
ncbi:Uncharacterized protein AB751O23_AI_00200 [Chlamydiales bacterium SCGC AB-751-O23]|jgi:membrane-bound serine protease (ClpP class)|nr:Uncharacterized protein AB751O23_AI_00200 [Chlamydiales bacterium SCGC AB-751-O23]